jgi:hypothetical protein
MLAIETLDLLLNNIIKELITCTSKERKPTRVNRGQQNSIWIASRTTKMEVKLH